MENSTFRDPLSERANDKLLLGVLCLEFIISLYLRMIQINKAPVYQDEIIRWEKTNLVISGNYEIWGQADLIHYLTAPFFLLFSNDNNELIIGRSIVIVVFSFSILLVYLLRNEFGNYGVIFIASAITFNPLFIIYPRVWKSDGVMLTFFLVLVICFFRYLQNRKLKFVIIGGLISGMMITTKNSGLVLFFILGSFLLLLILYEFIWNKDTFQSHIKKGIHKQYIKDGFLFFSFFIISPLLIYVLFSGLIFGNAGILGAIQDYIDTLFRYKGVVQTGTEKDYLFFIKQWKPQWHLWQIGLSLISIISIFAYLFRTKQKNDTLPEKKHIVFFLFLIYWFLVALMIYSSLSYKQIRFSMYFEFPLGLMIGYLPFIINKVIIFMCKYVGNYLVKFNPNILQKDWSKVLRYVKIGITILFILMNVIILSIAQIHGVNSPHNQSVDYQADAAEFILSTQQDINLTAKINVIGSTYPWIYYFRHVNYEILHIPSDFNNLSNASFFLIDYHYVNAHSAQSVINAYQFNTTLIQHNYNFQYFYSAYFPEDYIIGIYWLN